MGLRIGIGKKIGGVYVSASKTIGGGNRGKKGGGGCWTIGIAILFLPITLIYLFSKWAYGKTKQQQATDPEKVWYKQTWGIILMLVLFFPVGIYLMWKYGKRWNLYIKIAVCVFFGMVLIAIILPNNKKDTADISSSVSDSSQIELIVTKYEADALAKQIDASEEFEKSIKGTKIELTGIVKENKLNNSKIYINGDFGSGGWYQCKMSNKTDTEKVKPGDVAVIEGTVRGFNGHLNMEDCVLISCETPTEAPTEKVTEAITEKVTEAVEEELAENNDKETAEENYNEEQYEEAPQEDVQDEENDENQFIVYYTRTGKKYHYDDNCNGGTYYECTLEEALSRGLEPCGKCVN